MITVRKGLSIDRLRAAIAKYKAFLGNADYDELYKWEALKQFQENWNIEAEDFADMFNRSFNVNLSDDKNNLLAGKHFYPLQTLKDFIVIDAEQVRIMFYALYDEESGHKVENRIDLFLYHCEQMMKKVKEQNPEKENHYHGDKSAISVYLSFRYPELYTIYKFTEYKNFMAAMDARPLPDAKSKNIGRFFKLMRNIVYKQLHADEELVRIHSELRADEKYYQENSSLLTQDFYWCLDRFKL